MDTGHKNGEAPDPKPDKAETFPKEIGLTYDTKPIDNLTNAINQQTNSQQIEKNSPNSVGERQIKAQEKGNGIAKRGLYINGILGGFTIVALVISAKALNEASRATDAAIKADSIYLATLRWDSTKNAQANSTDSAKFQKQIDLTKKSLQIQIDQISEQQNEFEKINTSYIQIGHIKAIPDDKTKQIKITYRIVNLNIHPIQILSKYQYTNVGTSINELADTVFNDMNHRRFVSEAVKNVYIIKESELNEYYVLDKKMGFADGNYDDVVFRNYYIYLIIKIIYKDLVIILPKIRTIGLVK